MTRMDMDSRYIVGNNIGWYNLLYIIKIVITVRYAH